MLRKYSSCWRLFSIFPAQIFSFHSSSRKMSASNGISLDGKLGGGRIRKEEMSAEHEQKCLTQIKKIQVSEICLRAIEFLLTTTG